MRVSPTVIWVLVLLMASPALAQSRKRSKKSAPAQESAEPAPAAEEPEADTGWGAAMMDDIKGTKSKKAKGKKKKAAPVEEPVAEEPEPEPVEEPVEEPVAEEREPVPEAQAEPQSEPEADKAPTDKPAWWLGAYLHGVWVPSFMLGLFLEGPPTVANAAFGVTATHRNQDGFSLVLGLGYVGYSFEGAFQKTGDPEEDVEWVESNLGVVHVTGAMLWSSDLHEMFSIEYGIGLDLGIVTGSLQRTEAYRAVPGGAFAPCTGPLTPPAIATSGQPYCEVPMRNGVPIAGTNTYDEFGAHYNVAEERVPPIALLPALPQLALRFTPHRNVAIKLEAAYGILQFWFGLSAAYGLDL